MRWFKHLTHSASDEKLSRLMDEAGLEGYGFWWRVVEAVAEKVNEQGCTSVAFSVKKWGHNLGISPKKFRTLAALCARLRLLSLDDSENFIRIDIPNILKFRDEWTERKVRNSGAAQSLLRASRARVPETDPETDPDPKPPLAPAPSAAGPAAFSGNEAASGGGCGLWDLAFQQFVEAYPEGRRDPVTAWPFWLGLKKARALPGLAQLFDSLAQWEASAQWRKEGGQYVPLLSNWLKGRRWTLQPAPDRALAGRAASEADVLAELERLGLEPAKGGRP